MHVKNSNERIKSPFVLIQKSDIAEGNVFFLWVSIGKFVFCVNRKVIAGCATRTDMLFYFWGSR
jgi:hypothetical protein